MKIRKEKIEKPENIPIITREMMEKTTIEIARRHAGNRELQLKGIEDVRCPSCGNSSMSYADDLTFDVTLGGERVVIPNLTGLKCTKCREEAFDARSAKTIRLA